MTSEDTTERTGPQHQEQTQGFYTEPFPRDIRVKDYFRTVDSIVERYCATIGHHIDEHILVNANPWIIDTLASFDYYRRMRDGLFLYDQREQTVFHRGDSLLIPDSGTAGHIAQTLSNTLLDLNIPEYSLRVIEDGDTVHSFLVRVGRNDRKYLETAGHVVNLKTHSGRGEIVRIERNPWFVNPANGKRYFGTTRDDGRYTMMPLIPWIEPTMNGVRHGQLIHPTTNENTLGRAYSHGCIGLSEADMWHVYYSAPIGTRVNFRYDLKVRAENGDSILLDDIYGRRR
ncbi:MAG: L,D-transpeptidase [Flavobacteriales bacterium]|nr:L,D-transpeptidase [Flavobacteriales bacterium]